jgi:co-chaperonin GroES (HSP10)
MKVIPTNGRLLVESTAPEGKYKKTEGGIIMDTNASDKKIEVREILNVSIGQDEKDIGKRVVCNKYSIQDVKIGGEVHSFVMADEVIAVLEGE